MTINFNKEIDVEPDRLLTLVDGIFAIAITLLVMSIELPDSSIFQNYAFIDMLFKIILPQLRVVIISFIILSSLWVYHHEFIRVNKVSLPFIWLNIFYLLFIVLLPFTSSVAISYGSLGEAQLLFGLNITIALGLLILMFFHASYTDSLELNIKNNKVYSYKTLILLFIITIIVNIACYFISSLCIYLFLLIPILSSIRDIYT